MGKKRVRNTCLVLLICSILGIGSLWVWGTYGKEITGMFITREEPLPLASSPKLTVILNGSDISPICSARYEEGQTYVSALPILEKSGVAVLTSISSESHSAKTLLAVTQDHEVEHSLGTTEVSLDGETLTLAYPSFWEEDAVYVPLSFFEMTSGALLTENLEETHMELIVPAEGLNYQALNTQKNTPFFRADLLFRYTDYIKKNPTLDPEKAIIYVNANLDWPFYTNISEIANPDDVLMLSNKYNQFPVGYVPKDLKNVGGGFLLRAETAEAYQTMVQAAAEQGIFFRLRSAYRSYKEQEMIYNNSVARQGKAQADLYSARPGHSEHQSGLAVDVTIPSNVSDSLTSAMFETTPQFAWLQQHAHKYGFILRYGADQVAITGYAFEPWHYRYVGKDVAKVIYDQKLTFEEYMAKENVGGVRGGK